MSLNTWSIKQGPPPLPPRGDGYAGGGAGRARSVKLGFARLFSPAVLKPLVRLAPQRGRWGSAALRFNEGNINQEDGERPGDSSILLSGTSPPPPPLPRHRPVSPARSAAGFDPLRCPPAVGMPDPDPAPLTPSAPKSLLGRVAPSGIPGGSLGSPCGPVSPLFPQHLPCSRSHREVGAAAP